MYRYRLGACIVACALAFLTIGLVQAATIPNGREGDLIRYGRTLMLETPKYLGRYVSGGMTCASCHIDAGTKPHGGSLLGVYANYPSGARGRSGSSPSRIGSRSVFFTA